MPNRRQFRLLFGSLFVLTIGGFNFSPTAALGQWVVLHGEHGYAAHGIPANALAVLAEQGKPGVVLRSIAFAPSGGWVVVMNNNGLLARGIPDEALKMLTEARDKGAELGSITFAPGGGWVIFSSQGCPARNIDEEAYQTLNKLFQNGHRLKAIAFAPDGGWVILHDRHSFIPHNIPDDMQKKLGELAKRGLELKSVVFPPSGGWAIVYQKSAVAGKDLPPGLTQALKELTSKGADVKSLAFTGTRVIPIGRDDQKSRQAILDRMAHHKVPGLGIAYVSNGNVEWVRGYGVLRAGSSTAVTDQTRFQAASISKPVTAVAALRLVQAGILDLDQDLNVKLKTWKVPDNEFTRQKQPTLRQVLSHSAGFNVHGFGGYPPNSRLPTLLEVLKGEPPSNSPKVHVEYLPGTKSEYSGGGYCVLQQLIVDAAAGPFDEVMKREILEPAGMKHSTFHYVLTPDANASAANAHGADGEPFQQHWNLYEPTLAAAGLWTTPGDLASFVAHLIRAHRRDANPILSPTLIKQLLTPQIAGNGLGLFVEGRGKSMAFTHDGANAGYRCSLIGFPETGHGAVLMTNSDNGDRLCHELMESLRAEFGGPELSK